GRSSPKLEDREERGERSHGIVCVEGDASHLFCLLSHPKRVDASHLSPVSSRFSADQSMNLSFPLRVRAVMIDLDGTLVDSIPDLAAAANGMLREMGCRELDVEVIRTYVGKGIPNLVARSLTGSLDGAVPQELLERAMP